MNIFPTTRAKIKARIRAYEKALAKEKKTFGAYDDGYGKRYLLGPLYMLADDNEGALDHFEWFEEAFPDDGGEPFHVLCLALALYRAGREEQARKKLLEAMLSNLYIIPSLLGEQQEEHDMWHFSSFTERDYCKEMPELYNVWDKSEVVWAKDLYHSEAFSKLRARHVEIYHLLDGERDRRKRAKLIDAASSLGEAAV